MFYIGKIKGGFAMCPECHRFICEESCPNAVGRAILRGRPHLFCSRCRTPIAGGDKFYSIGIRAFCTECLEDADADELQSLFKYQTREELIGALGAASRIAFVKEERL